MMLITFEGPDGSGKTTQIQKLKQKLESLGYRVLVTREPGGTPMAEQIRELLLEKREEQVFGETEMFLYAGARSQHARVVIQPALEQGYVVLSDRYIDSSLIYQGVGRGLGIELVRLVNEAAIGGLWPQRTYLLDIGDNEARTRMRGRAGEPDRLELENAAFHQSIREGYLALQRREPERLRLIDASRAPELVEEEIWEDMVDLMAERKAPL